MKLTTDEIAVLRNDKKGGFTEESIALLINDKAPKKLKYSADKILGEYRREVKAEAKKEEAYLRSPLPRGEYEAFTRRVAASINPTIKNVGVIAGILNAKGLITNDERAAFSVEDKCESCSGKRPVAGGHCPPPKGTRLITTFDVWPDVDYKVVDKVMQCPLYKKKPGQ